MAAIRAGILFGIDGIGRLHSIGPNLIHISFAPFLLLFLVLSFLIMVATGMIGPSDWNWKRITFILLALLSYSLKDALLIKGFNFAFGLGLGGLLLACGF